ncbi:MAG: segregation/condensation protein A [Candidatus Diapherotrites archaeon]|nr:segregation/condensation protein A [Candidatus Diapherotrites archaeon]
MRGKALEVESVVPEPNVQIQSESDLVLLIEQPEWKIILIDLVEKERMNPWNIDIVHLADLYLKKIQSLQGNDLRLPANAMLASAILLKFKARALRISSIEEDREPVTATISEMQFLGGVMPELLNPRMVRQGMVSLDELVAEIEGIMAQSRARELKREASRLNFNIPWAPDNIEERMSAVLERVHAQADSTGLALFSTLVKGLDSNGVVDTFIPLLFLANEEKISLWQEEFFKEIFIALRGEDGSVHPSVPQDALEFEEAVSG